MRQTRNRRHLQADLILAALIVLTLTICHRANGQCLNTDVPTCPVPLQPFCVTNVDEPVKPAPFPTPTGWFCFDASNPTAPARRAVIVMNTAPLRLMTTSNTTSTCDADDIDRSLRYSLTPSYEYVRYICGEIHDWVHRPPPQLHIGIVDWLAQHGHDSPLATCTMFIDLDRTPRPDLIGWNVIHFTFHDKDYDLAIDRKAIKQTVVASVPCWRDRVAGVTVYYGYKVTGKVGGGH